MRPSLLEQARFNLLLPIICNIALTAFCVPRSSRKALTYYRAAQVYVRQPLDGETSQNPSTVSPPTPAPRWQRMLALSMNLLFSLLQGFVLFTSGCTYENSWWIVVSTRQTAPYALMFGLFYYTLWVALTLYANPIERLTRTHDAFDTQLPSMWTTDECAPELTAAEVRSTSSRIRIASLVLASATTFMCASMLSGNVVILLLAAACFYLCTQMMHIWPNLFFRCSIRIHALCLLALCLTVVVLLLLGAAFIFLIAILLKSTGWDEELEDSLPDTKPDHVMQQYSAVVDMVLWTMTYLLPASLLMLAYRIDASIEGHTDVDDADAALCLNESRLFAISLQETRRDKHPFDNAGRTAILTESIKSWQDTQERPNFRTALLTVYVVHALAVIVYFYVDTRSITVQFPHSNEEAIRDTAQLLFNIPAIVSWAAMIIVLPVCAGQRARSSGQTFGSGVRELWSYEENWFVSIPALPKRQPNAEVSDSVQDVETGAEAVPLLPLRDRPRVTKINSQEADYVS